MKQLFFTIAFSITALAQTEWAPPGLEQELEEKAAENASAIQELAAAFAQDPRFEVQQSNDQVVITRRTPPSEHPEDPVELQKPSNLQRVLNFGAGFGMTFAPGGSYSDVEMREGTRGAPRHWGFVAEAGVRPPTEHLKRLLVSAGIAPREKLDMVSYSHSSSTNMNPWVSAEWDILTISNLVSERALSVGGYFSRSQILYGPPGEKDSIRYPYNEKGFQVRWRAILSDSESPSSVHIVTRVSTKGLFSVHMGIGVSVGKRMWVKREVKK